MGRFLKNVLILGVVGWGAWWLWGFLGFGGAETPAPGTADIVVPARGPERLTEEGGVPSALPASAPAGPYRAVTDRAVTDLRRLLEAGRSRDAVRHARTLDSSLLTVPAVARLAMESARSLAASDGNGPGDRIDRADEARRLYGRLFVTGASSWDDVEESLDSLNREVLYGGREVPGTLFRYDVKAGDTLDGLLRKTWKGRVQVGYGLVLHVNSIPGPDRLRAKPIYVPMEPVRLLVRKGEFRLWVLLGEVPIRTFPVGLGMNGRTPEGIFEIEELLPKPDYWPPNGGRVPFGHPDNPLGTRWMGFRDTPDAQGFGIHGTQDPSSIGKSLSQGCVRLRNSDVERLFSWVAVGSKVEIQP